MIIRLFQAAWGPRAAVPLIPLAVLSGCSQSEFAPVEFDAPGTAVDYEIRLEGAPNEEIEALLQESLTLYRSQEDGAQSVAFLRRRARQDIDTAERIFRSYGYYNPEIAIDVVEPEAMLAEEASEDETEAASEEESEAEPPVALVTLTIAPGPLFTLARHDFTLTGTGATPPPTLDAAELGSPVGEAAAAQPILDAEAAAVSRLRRQGRPYAEFGSRDAVADLEAATLAVDSLIVAGPALVYGDVQFEGLEDVERDYLLTYREFEPGGVWDAGELQGFRNQLVQTNLFDIVRVAPPEDPPPGESAPVMVTVEERPFRTVSAGLRYSTDKGPGGRASFEHRNLFGSNETFRADAIASGLGAGVGLGDSEELGDQLELRLDLAYTEPQYLRPGQDFLAGLSLRRLEEDAFDETAATLTAGLERQLTNTLYAGGGGLLEYAAVTDQGDTQEFYLAGMPVFLRYDNTNDLLNPTAGARWRIDLAPFTGTTGDDETPLFTRIDAVGSTYFGLDEQDRYVLAGRARVGSVVTTDEDLVPKSRRLYSGGGGSVRGYAERSIGPLDDDDDPLGGLSVMEFNAEARAQVYGDFGVVAFAGAGAVGEESVPTFDVDPQYAAGAGLRYYSPVGPIRLDVAFPLNPRDSDDSWQLYISIGQAF